MAIYEYACEECGQQFEALRSMGAADDRIACKACGSERTRRALSVFFAHSKGRSHSHAGRDGCGNCQGGNCAGCRH